jgi:hypothetical protein
MVAISEVEGGFLSIPIEKPAHGASNYGNEQGDSDGA